jgi:hypothetical protein
MCIERPGFIGEDPIEVRSAVSNNCTVIVSRSLLRSKVVVVIVLIFVYVTTVVELECACPCSGLKEIAPLV